MPKKVECPVCGQEVEVVKTPTGDEFKTHFLAPLNPNACSASLLHLTDFPPAPPPKENDRDS